MGIEFLSELNNGRPEAIKSETEEKIYSFLDESGIEFLSIEHSPADTISVCHEIEKKLDARICKNLFLKNSTQTQYYLLLLDGDTKFESKVIAGQIGSTRLSFASSEKLFEYLGLEAGSVSVLGLINDIDLNVRLLIEDKLLDDEFFCCHPCKNTTTLKFRTSDIINRIIPAIGHNFTVVHT